MPWEHAAYESALVAAAALALYSPCVYPSIAGGDSGELIVSARELGVAHPPGYPLWTMASWLAIAIAPKTAGAAWVVGQLNAAIAATSVGTLYAVTLRLSSGNRASAALAAGLFATGRLAWTWAVTPEVFALNNLMTAVLLLLLVQFEAAPHPDSKLKVATWGAFASGLSLCNQHTIVVYVVVIAVYVLLALTRLKVLTISLFLRLALAGAAGLTPYLYLPWSALFSTSAQYTWGDQSTLGGLLTHLLRAEYGTFDLGKDSTGAGFLGNCGAFCGGLVDELSYFGIALALIGAIAGSQCRLGWRCETEPAAAKVNKRSSARRADLSRAGPAAASEQQQQQPPPLLPSFLNTRSVTCVLVAALVCYVSLFCWRANLDITRPLLLKVTERFWLQASIVVALLAGLGFYSVLSLLSNVFPRHTSHLNMVQWIVASALLLFSVKANYAECNHGADVTVHNFASETMASLPADALVLTRGDLPMLTFRYLQLCEGVRRDVTFIDQELLSYAWYARRMKQQLRGDVVFPGDVWWPSSSMHRPKAAFDFAALLDANYNRRAILACIGVQEHDASWQKRYALMPYGVCHQFVRSGAESSKDWVELRQPYAANWSYAHDSFQPGTWEKVANDEMWNAKISKAFYLYDEAVRATGTVRLQLHYDSFFLYEQLVTQHTADGFPSYWHKNLALAAERLLASASTLGTLPLHGHTAASLAVKAALHFELYALSNPQDPQSEQIMAAARSLRKALSEHRQPPT